MLRDGTREEVERVLCDAIHRQDLGAVLASLTAPGAIKLEPTAEALVRQASNTLNTIKDQTATLRRAFEEKFTAAGIAFSPGHTGAQGAVAQYQQVAFEIAPQDLSRALPIAAEEGFEAAGLLGNGAITALSKFNNQVQFTRRDDALSRLTFHWRQSGLAKTLPRPLQPALQDYASASLPHALWPVYSLLKLQRVIRTRTIGRSRGGRGFLLHENLGTPLALAGPLVAFAGLTSSDHLVDVGCGDARFLIEAARLTGCRATGVEMDPACAHLARDAVHKAGMSKRVTIVEGKAEPQHIADGTVIFTFQPPGALPAVISLVLANLSKGARLIVHEQLRLPDELKANHVQPLFGDNALTVAYYWDKSD